MKTARAKKIFPIIAALMLAASIVVAPLFAYANSADRYWYSGSAGTGTVSVGNCPLTVEREELVFNVPTLPSSLGSAQDYLSADSSVEAKYTFYNPTDTDISARLAFPFGLPSYYMRDLNVDDTAKYGVTVDGAAADTVLRHTYFPQDGEYGKFDTDAEIVKLDSELRKSEEYVQARDMPVTAYTFEVNYNPQDVGKYSNAYIETVFESSDFMMSHYCNSRKNAVGYEIGLRVRSGETFVFYDIGDAVGNLHEWKIYQKSYGGPPEIQGSVSLVSTQNMTFEQFVMQYRPEDSAVSRDDWLEAALFVLCYNNRISGDLGVTSILDVSVSLMRWYEYTLNVPALSRVVNTVRAPLYPSINGWYSPPKYDFSYLLSPAKRWAAFGSLDVTVNTPFYLTGSDGIEFERADGGYTCSLGGLPDGEMEFTLCTVESPEHYNSGCNGTSALYVMFILLAVGVPVTIIALIVVSVTLLAVQIAKMKTK